MALERVLLKPPQEAEEIVYDMFHHTTHTKSSRNRPIPLRHNRKTTLNVDRFPHSFPPHFGSTIFWECHVTINRFPPPYTECVRYNRLAPARKDINRKQHSLCQGLPATRCKVGRKEENGKAPWLPVVPMLSEEKNHGVCSLSAAMRLRETSPRGWDL
ncbi:hypothetical protein CpipJ_CPIJ011437 [Culex quinquefasciatus]|uniref:Uncharacterized protein n=1 Tax=Culex quinquefasciatus TaxID=7176 RepID=B0WVR0_CULQU|nr:hypothetical protein CpipJ_CPIJ011437 [Culex quinquefasciatus]|eukprot:XP_001861482.1 hypothetical protein CpipJ_CPIJ011437 [Culex quinquefasciatus]